MLGKQKPESNVRASYVKYFIHRFKKLISSRQELLNLAALIVPASRSELGSGSCAASRGNTSSNRGDSCFDGELDYRRQVLLPRGGRGPAVREMGSAAVAETPGLHCPVPAVSVQVSAPCLRCPAPH